MRRSSCVRSQKTQAPSFFDRMYSIRHGAQRFSVIGRHHTPVRFAILDHFGAICLTSTEPGLLSPYSSTKSTLVASVVTPRGRTCDARTVVTPVAMDVFVTVLRRMLTE